MADLCDAFQIPLSAHTAPALARASYVAPRIARDTSNIFTTMCASSKCFLRARPRNTKRLFAAGFFTARLGFGIQTQRREKFQDQNMRDQQTTADARARTSRAIQWAGDAQNLERALKKKISGEVRFDNGSRALYATDSSNYRQIPIGVVVPKTIDDVVQTISVCREFSAPVLSRGGGTSLAGQCCNVAVVLDFSKYLHKILELKSAGKIRAHRAGNCFGRFARRSRKTSSDLRARSFDAQSLHAWAA